MARRGLLTVIFLCALSFGSVSIRAQTPPAQQSDQPLVDQVLQSLTPREKIGQLFIVGFEGPTVSEQVRQFIMQHKVGGVYLSRETCNIMNGSLQDQNSCNFGDDPNPDTAGQVAGFAQGLQQASCDATKGAAGGTTYCLPLFVAIDHEGDDRPLNRLIHDFTPIPSNMTIGATFDPKQAKAIGCIVGKELAAVGINMLFGPDLDLLASPRSSGPGDQGIRTFGGNPLWVAEMAPAYVQGVQDCGAGKLATVAKHFPGHGQSTRNVDSEDIPVVVGKTIDQLAQLDLAPFAAVSKGKPGQAGMTDAIMNSHLSYPQVQGCDERTPVTFSPSCMQAFYGQAQFVGWRQAGGLTVADDLASGAVQAYAQEKYGTYAQDQIAADALLAGNDLLPLIRPWQWQALGSTMDQLESRYQSDETVHLRVDDAVRRILSLKYRTYSGFDPGTIAKPTAYKGIVGQKESADQVTSIVDESLTFIKPANRDAFLNSMAAPKADEKIVFVECWDDPECAPPNDTDTPNYPPLWPRGKLAALTAEMFPSRVSKDNLKSISFSELGAVLNGGGDPGVRRLIADADWLVFGYLERDPSGYPDSEVLKDFLQRGRTVLDLRSKKVVVFAYNSPYHFDSGEVENVDLFVGLYTKIEPALRASLKTLFQDATLLQGAGGQGSLPVDYIYENSVLYNLNKEVAADPAQSVQVTISPDHPRVGDRVTVSLTNALMALNGHRVPNGTPVEFVFDLPGGTSQPVAAATTDGIASADIAPSKVGRLGLTIRSGDLQWSPPKAIAIGGGDRGPPLVLILVVVVGGLLLALTAFMAYLYKTRDWLLWRPGGIAPTPPSDPGGAPPIATQQGDLAKTLARPSVQQRSFGAGRYRVSRLLGEGGQKIVFLAHDTQLDRDVAIGVLKTDGLDPAGVARARKEARTMAGLGAQPHIVSVFDIGEEEGRPYTICEYMSGGDLQSELVRAGGLLPVGRVLAIGQDLCAALALAHGMGVLHRDIKPANIWLTKDGTAKLGDFGLALAIDRTRLTVAGSVMGTAAYMAPEQAMGTEVDARSDLYSLGCVLYEAVCGRPPFLGDNAMAVMSQHVHAPPAPPSSYNPDVPKGLERLIMMLLAKAKEDRPASAEEASAEIACVQLAGKAEA